MKWEGWKPKREQEINNFLCRFAVSILEKEMATHSSIPA